MRHSGNLGGKGHGKMTGKEAEINKAAEYEPRERRGKPVPAAGVGNEKKADVKGAQEGGDRAEGGHLRGAMRELGEQHPLAHHDHGPHHGMEHHKRHEPLHGMKPRS